MEEKLANPIFMSEPICMLSLVNATQVLFGGLAVNLIQKFPGVLTTMPVTVLSCCVVYSLLHLLCSPFIYTLYIALFLKGYQNL